MNPQVRVLTDPFDSIANQTGGNKEHAVNVHAFPFDHMFATESPPRNNSIHRMAEPVRRVQATPMAMVQ